MTGNTLFFSPMGLQAGISVPPTGTTFPTWDTATASNVTFSGGNLVATSTGGTTDHGAHVAAAAGLTAGKHYFEVTVTTYAGGGDTSIGIGTPTSTYAGMGGGGGVTGDVVYFNGNIYANGSTPAAVTPFTTSGSIVGVAVDLDNRKIWFRSSTTPGAWSFWNGNAGYNPTSNTGGITIPAGTMVPFITFNASGNVFTANFGASAFIGPVPSGFASGWV